MDFRVTHFLVAGSSASAPSSTALSALANGQIAAYSVNHTSGSAVTELSSSVPTAPFYFAQGLDSTDAIQKELGVIKSGVINPSKIVSVRKLVGSDDYSRQAKVFGAAATMLTYNGSATGNGASSRAFVTGSFYYSGSGLYYCIANSTSNGTITAGTYIGDVTAAGTDGLVIYLGDIYVSGTTSTSNKMQITTPTSTGVGTLEFEVDKEYTFSVRVRSAKANSISPFGITRGYSAMSAGTFINTASGVSSTSDGYAPFSALFNLVKNFASDTMLVDFANVTAVMYYCGSANGTVTDVVYFKNGSIANADSTYDGISVNMTSNIPVHLLISSKSSSSREVVIDVTKYTTWHEALTAAQAVVSGTLATHQGTVLAGKTYSAALIVDAKEQTNYNLSYASGVTDPTVFPYKWDVVRLNGFFHEGPYGKNYDWYATAAINAGVSTQTPIVFDQTQSGLITPYTIAINLINFSDSAPVASTQPVGFAIGKYVSGTTSSKVFSVETQVKFPNLLKEEVRHIAHQYQSYSLKYKQQFRSPRYNAMVMDPYQSKIDAAGPYTLYYIEYAPDVDVAYTSTQNMTNLTIIAVPTANTSVTTYLNALVDETTETAS